MQFWARTVLRILAHCCLREPVGTFKIRNTRNGVHVWLLPRHTYWYFDNILGSIWGMRGFLAATPGCQGFLEEINGEEFSKQSLRMIQHRLQKKKKKRSLSLLSERSPSGISGRFQVCASWYSYCTGMKWNQWIPGRKAKVFNELKYTKQVIREGKPLKVKVKIRRPLALLFYRICTHINTI